MNKTPLTSASHQRADNAFFVQTFLVLAFSLFTIVLLIAARYELALLPAVVLFGLVVFGPHPQRIFLLIVGLIPFWGLREFAGVNIQWPLGLLMLLILLAKTLPSKQLPSQLRSDFWPLFFALLAVFVLSAVMSPFPDTAWHNVGLLVAGLAFTVFGFLMIDRRIYQLALPAVIVLSVSMGSLAVVVDYLFDPAFLPVRERGFALTIHPNTAGQMAIAAIPLAVHLVLFAERASVRWLSGLAIVVNLMAVMATFSRSAFIVLFVMLVLLVHNYAYKLRVKQAGLVVAVVMLAIGVVMLSVPPAYWDRQLSTLEWQDVSLRRRAAYLFVGWDAFREAPLLGKGPGTYQDLYAYSQYAAEFWSEEESAMRRVAHNGYLEILVGTGLLGLLAFGGVLLKSVVNFNRARRQFWQLGQERWASLTGCYRTSLITLLLYLTVGSHVYDKLLLLLIAVSHVAWLLSREAGARQRDASEGS
jgi:O-antigen ligase